MKLIPIKNQEGLFRDKDSMGIINTDKKALEAYRNKKKTQKEIDCLREEVSEIKTLLFEVLKRLP